MCRSLCRASALVSVISSHFLHKIMVETSADAQQRLRHTLCFERFTSLNLEFLLGLTEHTLCLEQFHGCLFQPLYTCTSTSLCGLRAPFTDQWEHQQYNPVEPRRPITGLEICCRRRRRGEEEEEKKKKKNGPSDL